MEQEFGVLETRRDVRNRYRMKQEFGMLETRRRRHGQAYDLVIA
jgi:hypothetical protein